MSLYVETLYFESDFRLSFEAAFVKTRKQLLFALLSTGVHPPKLDRHIMGAARSTGGARVCRNAVH